MDTTRKLIFFDPNTKGEHGQYTFASKISEAYIDGWISFDLAFTWQNSFLQHERKLSSKEDLSAIAIQRETHGYLYDRISEGIGEIDEDEYFIRYIVVQSMCWFETQALIAQKAAAARRLYSDILTPPTPLAERWLPVARDARAILADHLVCHESDHSQKPGCAHLEPGCAHLETIKMALPEQCKDLDERFGQWKDIDKFEYSATLVENHRKTFEPSFDINELWCSRPLMDWLGHQALHGKQEELSKNPPLTCVRLINRYWYSDEDDEKNFERCSQATKALTEWVAASGGNDKKPLSPASPPVKNDSGSAAPLPLLPLGASKVPSEHPSEAEVFYEALG